MYLPISEINTILFGGHYRNLQVITGVMLFLKQILESAGRNSFCPVQTDLSIFIGKYNHLRESLFLMSNS